MNRERYSHVGEYSDPHVREIAHGIKKGRKSSIRTAAAAMAAHVTRDSLLIPIPSHYGYPTVTLSLALRIAESSGCKVIPWALRGRRRARLYMLKKYDRPIPSPEQFFRFRLGHKLPQGRDLVLIDNVTATRMTAEACLKLIPEARVLTYADDSKARKEQAI